MEKLIITNEEQLKKLFKEILADCFLDFENNSPKKDLGDYIEEKQAIQLLGRKTTWFYNMRQSGLLPYSKIGSKTYYCKIDLLNILEKNKK